MPAVRSVGAVLATLALAAAAGCAAVVPEPGAAPSDRGVDLSPGAPRSGPPSAMPAGPPAAASITALAPLTVFYVAVDDGGVAGPAIGCGDSVVATATDPAEFTDQVEGAIRHLLAGRERYVAPSGLLNALHRSELEYVGATVRGDTVTVLLTGAVVSGGTCDDARIHEQLRHTAMLAAGTPRAEILVDGTPLWISRGPSRGRRDASREQPLLIWQLGLLGCVGDHIQYPPCRQ